MKSFLSPACLLASVLSQVHCSRQITVLWEPCEAVGWLCSLVSGQVINLVSLL